MLQKIAVQLKSFRCKPQIYPFWIHINGMLPFLQENNIRNYLCPCVGFKGIIGKSDRSQQFRPLCQITPCVWIFGIHGVAAGHKSHDTARANLIQRFGKEIVVDGKSQLVIGLI